MLKDYSKEIQELTKLYKLANELIIISETYAKKSQLAFVYQLKDAYNHMMDAFDLCGKPGDHDVEIRSQLSGSRGHLVRLIFDVSELFCLRALDKIYKTFDKYPTKILNKVFENYDSTIKPQINAYKSQLADWKIYKASYVTYDDIKKVYDIAQKIRDFSNETLAKKKNFVFPVIYEVLKIVVPAIVGSLVTYGISVLFA